MKKYYAVKVGKTIGIFETWEECQKQVSGFKGAKYKSFKTLQEANNYLNDTTKSMHTSGLVAYVDGSYNASKQLYGYGCILLSNDHIIAQYYGKGDNPEHLSMRNVAGEIMGAIKAISYATENSYDHITIYYDYEGIEKWATGMWKTNKPGTIAYKSFIDQSKTKIDIKFTKVAAHTGVTYNEAADLLAKKAVGIS